MGALESDGDEASRGNRASANNRSRTVTRSEARLLIAGARSPSPDWARCGRMRRRQFRLYGLRVITRTATAYQMLIPAWNEHYLDALQRPMLVCVIVVFSREVLAFLSKRRMIARAHAAPWHGKRISHDPHRAVAALMSLLVVAWSPLALGAGDTARGSTLYQATYLCTDCHSVTPSAGQITSGSTADGLLTVIRAVPRMRNRYLSTLGENPTDLADIAAYIASFGAPIGGGPDLNQHGLTGSWFEPATSGQGIELEVLSQSRRARHRARSGRVVHVRKRPGRWRRSRAVVHVQRQRAERSGQRPGHDLSERRRQFQRSADHQCVARRNGHAAFTDCNNATFTYTFTDGTGRTRHDSAHAADAECTCAVGTTRNQRRLRALGQLVRPARRGRASCSK